MENWLMETTKEQKRKTKRIDEEAVDGASGK